MRLAAVHKRFIEGTKIGIIVAAHFKLVTVLSKAVAPKN
jgi:hypothetical protein